MMDDPQHLLAHNQLLAQLHGASLMPGAGGGLVFVQPPKQGAPAPHAHSIPQQNLVWTPKDQGMQQAHLPASANQAAVLQAMQAMQLTGGSMQQGNTITTAAAAAAIAASQQARAAQAGQQAQAIANMMQQQQAQQAQQAAQRRQLLAQQQQQQQNALWLNAVQQQQNQQQYQQQQQFQQQQQRGAYIMEQAKPLLSSQMIPPERAALQQQQQQQLLLLAMQQQQQQRAAAQPTATRQLQAALLQQQQQQQQGPPNLHAHVSQALNNLWQQQQQQQVKEAQAAQQAQRKIRQNMAALQQLQAMGAMPPSTPANASQSAALMQAQQVLLQAQAQARAQQQARSAAIRVPSPAAHAADAALLASFRLTEQQRMGRPTAPAPGRPDPSALGLQLPAELTGLAAGGAGSPPAPLAGMSQEQRRMALACVALQLIQNNITVDQAIHSGIMGGLSVTDVKFIVEVHDAHMARLKQAQAQHGAASVAELAAIRAADALLQSPLAGLPSSDSSVASGSLPRSPAAGLLPTRASGSSSPAPSVGSDHGGNAGSAPPSLSAAAGAHGPLRSEESFDAFSYGFFGSTGAGMGGAGAANAELMQELERGREAALDGASGDIPSWMSEGALPDAWNECYDGEGADAAYDARASMFAAPAPAEQQARAPAAPAAVDDGNDVAARLANLDLGYGFF